MANQATFGKYRLLAELGHGGMADVFLAVAEGPQGLGFSKLAVVKKLRPGLADDFQFVAMLVDEARIAARLNHPNCVQTYEIGEMAGQYFIAMEYLDGQPLSRIAQRMAKEGRAMPLEHAVSIYADVLAGLHHAHELEDYDGSPLGIVHRDVSPHNVFVTYEGQVKIVDFGIAKAAGRVLETKQGIIKGKTSYMAPEQARGIPDIDRRADIFAVGVMLWDTLVGRSMWGELDGFAIAVKLVSNELPGRPSTQNPRVDPTLDAICAKALANKREDRYATAEEMANELLAWLRDHGGRPLARDVGKGIADVFADRRKETRELIEEQLAQMRRGATPVALKTVPTAGPMDVTPVKLGPATPKNAVVTPTSPSETTSPLAGTLVFGATEVAAKTPEPSISPAAVTMVSMSAPRSSTTNPSILEPSAPAPTTMPSPNAARPRVGLYAMGAAVVAIAVGVAVWRARPSSVEPAAHAASTTPASAPLAASAPSASPPASASAAPARASISLALTSNVAGTTFRVDDGPALASPYAGTHAKSDTVHVIVASAPGFEDERREVSFATDVAWAAKLQKKTGKPTGPAAHASRVSPSSATTAAEPPPPPPSATASSKRAIDEDNPYLKKK